jgi:hypothetical protein
MDELNLACRLDDLAGYNAFGLAFISRGQENAIAVRFYATKSQPMSDRGDYYRLNCRFCHTMLTVVPEQEGTEVKCPDCYSMLKVGPPPVKKDGKSGRGGRAWIENSSDETDLPALANHPDDDLLPANNDLIELIDESPTTVADTTDHQNKSNADSSELKLADSFDRPAVGPLYGFDESESDLLAPRKRRRNPEPEDEGLGEEDLQPIEDIDDLPLPEADIPSLESIGKLVPESEPDEQVSSKRNTAAGENGSGNLSSKKRRKKKSKKNRRQNTESPIDEVELRPRFKHAELFMAMVSMITDLRVLMAAGVAVLLMLVGGIACESILPVGYDTSEWDMGTTLGKSSLKALFGYLPYYAGLLALWTTAGFIFRDAAEGYAKVQRWTVAGQSEFWSTFLLFSFSFFIAGLPAFVFSVLMIPMRMIIAPLFLISAWFGRSPWMIINTDWFTAVSNNKSQWTVVYTWFVAMALIGIVTGLMFFVRRWIDVFVVDVLLTMIGIGFNTVLTLAFAAIAGWHTGAVIESLDDEG